MATPHQPVSVAGIAPGALLGKYQVLKHLATGGMAEIFLARTLGVEGFERYVVVKCIKPAFADDAQFVQMFLDEARISAQLHHQHIAQVFDMGVEANNLYFAMEYVHGQNVQSVMNAAHMQGRHIPYEHAIAIVLGAATGLDYAHDRVGSNGAPLEIVHRDVTPTNILVSYDGAVKVVDFGIVKATTRATHTRSGVLKGKLQCMSPEQCRSGALDRRSDVFALGILLYELTTLEHLYQGSSDYETMDQIVRAEVTPPSRKRASYPEELEAIVLTCLAKDPAARYQTAGALVEDLLSFVQRAMLTPSATGLSRFMRELFGNPGEPWLGVPLPPTPPFVPAPSPMRAWTPLDARPAHADEAMRPLRGVALDALHPGELAPSGEILVPAPTPTPVAPPRRRGLVMFLAAASVLAIAAIAMLAIGRGGDSVAPAPATTPPAGDVATSPPAAVAEPPAAPSRAPSPPAGEPAEAAPALAPTTTTTTAPAPASTNDPGEPRRKPARRVKPVPAPTTTPTPPSPTPTPIPEPEPAKLRDGGRLRPPD